jgi:RimJ/RimL family protein N-acetyltransferase
MRAKSNKVDEVVTLPAHYKFCFAKAKDAEVICDLYRKVYDRSYPLLFGMDLQFTKNAINDDKRWIVFIVKDETSSLIIGAINFEIDQNHDLAIIQGLVIDPKFRKGNLGSELVSEGTKRALELKSKIKSIFGAARVINRAPQKICLQSGYLPFGIYPNIYYISDFETLALVVTHRKEVLENRASGYWIPPYMQSLYQSIDQSLGVNHFYPCRELSMQSDFEFLDEDFELEKYTYKDSRKFKKELTTPLFKPTHKIKGDQGKELYIYLNESGKHASIIGTSTLNLSCELIARVTKTLQSHGINYIQTYIRGDQCELIDAFVSQGYITSAIYPAMKKEKSGYFDYVVLSQSFHPIEFINATFEKRFYPFLESYLKLGYMKKLKELNFFKVA